ncbi:MAG: hypothetical protein ABSH28_00900 [Acidobacteriota bacterium]
MYWLLLLAAAGLFISYLVTASPASSQNTSRTVLLNWLDSAAPSASQGVSFGVPWPKGALQKNASLSLRTSDGKSMPVQTWPLAYWPDGSLKWTGHALSASSSLVGSWTLSPGNPAAQQTAVRAIQNASGIEIDAGAMQCRIPREGAAFIESLKISNREVANNEHLVVIREDRSGYETNGVLREEKFASQIKAVTLEQSRPVRAVVKIKGVHKAANDHRGWLPFTVRLYFFAGLDSVRMVHSFVFDGDQEKDFIRGLGVRFAVPMREQFHNRHSPSESHPYFFAITSTSL